MSDDPAKPTLWEEKNKGNAKAAFNEEREISPPEKEKSPAASLPSHSPAPKLALDMKGPIGDASRKNEDQAQRAKLDEAAKEKNRRILETAKSMQKDDDMVKSKDKDGKGK